MKIGTDAMLLGGWAGTLRPKLPAPKRILDVGTGSGIIALMLAQRFPAALVTAIEIDFVAGGQAEGNFAASPFFNRLTVICSAVQDFRSDERYDLIVCNPPWFQNSFKPPGAARTMARHSDTLSLEELSAAASRLLSPGGILSVILPIEQSQVFTSIAAEYGLQSERVCEVLPTPTSPPKRTLLEFSNGPPAVGSSQQRLVVEVSRHVYSEEFRQLVKEFLLKL